MDKGLVPPLGSYERALFFQWLTFLNNTLQAELMVYYYAHRHTTDEASIPSIIKAQEAQIAKALDVIDKQLQGNEYILGDSISACDFFFFMLAEWALKIERSPVTFANIAPYLKRMSDHPTIKAVCEIEEIDLTPFQ